MGYIIGVMANDNVINLTMSHDVPAVLRRIAEQVENGERTGEKCVMVLDEDIFAFGSIRDDEALRDGVYMFEFGKQMLIASSYVPESE